MSAVASGLLSFSLLSYFKPMNFSAVQSGKRNIMYKGVKPILLGGMITGIGLALAGACPGIVYVQVSFFYYQIGNYVPKAFIVLAGCFTGGFVYGIYSSCII